jgi:hypothetical protein
MVSLVLKYGYPPAINKGRKQNIMCRSFTYSTLIFSMAMSNDQRVVTGIYPTIEFGHACSSFDQYWLMDLCIHT